MSDYDQLGGLFNAAVKAADGVKDVQDKFQNVENPDPVTSALENAERAFRAVADRCQELLANR
jgi:hypothetical protein